MTNYFRALYYLRGLMKRAYWKREKLIDYQSKKLRKIVEYAYDTVPYYHEKFREVGVLPEDIRTAEDLNKLPIIRKDEIRKNLSEVVSRDFDVADLKMLSTSGSTGQPLFVYITGTEDEYRKAKHLRANISCGQRPRDKWVTITRHFEPAGRLQRLLRIYAVDPVSVFDDTATQISTIEKLKPDVLDGYSNSLLSLAKEIDKKGIETIKPRLLFGGAELIADSSRKLIEKVFAAPFYDQYAIVELERMAWQCPEKRGYHVDADSILMQFVDEDGEEVAPGERGEIVCTSLFNYAMPFVRYAVDDLGVASEESDCPCGRNFPLMKVVEGRKDSLLLLPDGRVLAPFTFIAAMITFKFYRYIDLFRVVQQKMDVLSFRIKMKNRRVDERTVKKELLAHLEKVLNVETGEVRFEVEFVDDIPLDKSGKFSLVVSELNEYPKL